MKKIFQKILTLAGALAKLKFVYIPLNRFGRTLTAVKSDIGFWYAGNVFDIADIAYGILHSGVVEREGTFLVKYIITELQKAYTPTVFYDIGANTGYFGLMAAFLGKGNVRTYAFDPVKELNETEQQSVILNHLEDVCQIFNVALANYDGRATIYLSGSGTSLYKSFVGNTSVASRMVSLAKLDSFVEQRGLPDPHFVKIDVEGAELEVLKGAVSLLERSCPVVWYESARTIRARNLENAHFEETHQLLEDRGYCVFYCGPVELVEVSRAVVPDGVAMYLALHSIQHSQLLEQVRYSYGEIVNRRQA